MIAGPTASGKSELAIALAERLNGVVINADALQVYADLKVLTARPRQADEARVPHRLYGVLSGNESCSAGRWSGLATAEVRAAHDAGSVPVLVGGTGLYLDALINGLAEIPDIEPGYRTAAADLYVELGPEAFRAALAQRDPVSAARFPPQDRQRLTRAWEVVEATGRPLPEWQDAPVQAPEFSFTSVLVWPPRETLYERCDQRFDLIMEQGGLAEVEALTRAGRHAGFPVSKAIGVQELGAFLAGTVSLDDAVTAAKTATRRFAKRQRTWFRHRFNAQHTLTEKLYSKNTDTLLSEIT